MFRSSEKTRQAFPLCPRELPDQHLAGPGTIDRALRGSMAERASMHATVRPQASGMAFRSPRPLKSVFLAKLPGAYVFPRPRLR